MPRRNKNANKRGMKRGGKHKNTTYAPLSIMDLHPRKKTGRRM